MGIHVFTPVYMCIQMYTVYCLIWYKVIERFKFSTNKPAVNRLDYLQINDHLKGLQVQVTHNGHPRKHRVVALKEEPANRHQMTGQY